MTTRVLHLIEAASPHTTPAVLRQLALAIQATAGACEHTVWLIGGDAWLEHARAAGLDADWTPLPGQRAVIGLAALRRRFAQAKVRKQFDVVHSVSLGPLCAASMLRFPGRYVVTLYRQPGERTQRWMRRLVRRRGLDVLTAAPMDLPQVQTKPVGLATAPLDLTSRDALRQQWGVRGDSPVVALLSDPAWSGNAIDGALALSLARESIQTEVDPAVASLDPRLILHPAQARRDAAEPMMVLVGATELVVQSAQVAHPWRCLAGADAALVLGPWPSPAAVWARAAGLPLIAEDRPETREVLGHDAALWFPVKQPKAAAHHLHEIWAGRTENQPAASPGPLAPDQSGLSAWAEAIGAVASA